LDIQQRALQYLKVKDLQEGIVLSPAVQQAIQGFKEKYN
jgi:hypothetical protein